MTFLREMLFYTKPECGGSMSLTPPQSNKVHISLSQKLNLLWPYIRKKIAEQVKSVWVIILYLIFFQTMILGIGIAEASLIAAGLSVVILGLAFFMEGLFLGLMPLGETIGLKLPQKSKLPGILLFSFILGFGVTLAEPAIGVLKAAGSAVTAWEAPLMFVILNKHSSWLVNSVGLGVGVAVLFGMLRFLYNWSLKPFLYILVSLLSLVTIIASLNPNLIALVGLAWDCGGVTTGPVTVPLVLALGIGVCRVVSSGNSENSGFGVVTLASLFPILAVFILGFTLLSSVPQPMEKQDFFSESKREAAISMFPNESSFLGYALLQLDTKDYSTLFNGDSTKEIEFLGKLSANEQFKIEVFGDKVADFKKKIILSGSEIQKTALFGSTEKAAQQLKDFMKNSKQELNLRDVLKRQGLASVQAIIPLSILLMLVLFLFLRERLPHPDEVLLGITFGLIGMGLFNIGIELGLSKLGAQVGSKLPSSFKEIQIEGRKISIPNFKEEIVQSSIDLKGNEKKFFFMKQNDKYIQVPFDDKGYDKESRYYEYVPTRGPLYGDENGFWGKFIVLLFAFFMGYGATLAEPALNALGSKVEELTVGTFRKSLLMQAVAIGVGLGMFFGLVKIIWNIPLAWLLIPPYLLLLFMSKISSEEFTNIAWDSAGVTTGPITVPLVLAMGLGIGTQIGVVEGFGILAMASVFPILTVLITGLVVNNRRRQNLGNQTAS